MTINDGPIINKECIEKLKCIKKYTVYFHIVLIKYIRSIIGNLFSGMSIVTIFICVIMFFILIKIII